LINWITGAIKEEIDLFDDHPLSFLDEEFYDKKTEGNVKGNEDLKKVVDERESISITRSNILKWTNIAS